MGPSSARPGASSASGLAVSTVVLTNAIHLLVAATLCAYEQQKTYISARTASSDVCQLIAWSQVLELHSAEGH